MKAPIIYYALMVDCTAKGKGTPKYRIEKEALDYPPMKKIVGKDGFVNMYFKPNPSKKADAPEMNLQAKNSLNFTGVKFMLNNGVMDVWAYGNPLQSPIQKTISQILSLKTDLMAIFSLCTMIMEINTDPNTLKCLCFLEKRQTE